MTNDSGIVKAAFIQAASYPGDVGKNGIKAGEMIKKACDDGAELVVLPELFNVGYDLSILKQLMYNFNDEIRFYSNLASSLKIYIVCGMLEDENGRLYNSLVVLNKEGEITAKYRKNNLFPLSYESKVFTRGKEPVIFKMPGFSFGLAICYDIRFPELFRIYADKGCNAIIVASAFPFPRLEHCLTLLKAQAILYQVYIVVCNRVGRDNDFWFVGNSCIIDPWGSVLCSMDETEEGFRITSLVSERVDEIRSSMPALDDRQKQYKIRF